jgi:hypothetical protein
MLQVQREQIHEQENEEEVYDEDDVSSGSSIVDEDIPTEPESSDGEEIFNKKGDKEETGIQSSKKTKKEVRQVKLLVLIVVLISIVGAILVFFYTTMSEQQQFEHQFEDDANKVSIFLGRYLRFLFK